MLSYQFAGYLLFAFITSITPGPNNILLFSHGKAFGFKGSRKLIIGIFLGFLLMLYAAGYGIAEIITRNQVAGVALKIGGSAFLIYLAFLIRKIDVGIAPGKANLIGFWKILIMQFVNPKAWIMAVSGASAFLPQTGNIHFNVFVFSFSFCLIGIPCMLAWVLLGDAISRFLKSQRAHLFLGNILFLLLITSVIMIWV